MNYILTTELTEKQKWSPDYQWAPENHSGPLCKARSLHDAIIRNSLGDKRATHHIYQHGLPRLLDAPVLRQARPATAAEHHALDELAKEPTEEVQAALAETIQWLASLATAIYSTKADKNMPLLQMLSMRWEALSREQRQGRQARKIQRAKKRRPIPPRQAARSGPG